MPHLWVPERQSEGGERTLVWCQLLLALYLTDLEGVGQLLLAPGLRTALPHRVLWRGTKMVISDKNLVSYLPLGSCSQVRWLWSRVLPRADNTNETSLSLWWAFILGSGFFGNAALISSVISNCAGGEGFAQILCKRLLVFSLKVFNHTNVSRKHSSRTWDQGIAQGLSGARCTPRWRGMIISHFLRLDTKKINRIKVVFSETKQSKIKSRGSAHSKEGLGDTRQVVTPALGLGTGS